MIINKEQPTSYVPALRPNLDLVPPRTARRSEMNEEEIKKGPIVLFQCSKCPWKYYPQNPVQEMQGLGFFNLHSKTRRCSDGILITVV